MYHIINRYNYDVQISEGRKNLAHAKDAFFASAGVGDETYNNKKRGSSCYAKKNEIQVIDNLSNAINNPASGDAMIFNVDGQASEDGLAAVLGRLRERGITIINPPAGHAAPNDLLIPKGKGWRAYLNELPIKPKRVFVFADNHQHLLDIQQDFNDADNLYLKHYVATHLQPLPVIDDSQHVFPSQLDGFVVNKRLGGGTASVFSIHHPDTHQDLVLKCGAHADAAKIEMLCHAVYRALQVKVPKMRVYHTLPVSLASALSVEQQHGLFQVSELIHENQAANSAAISAAARKDFAAHVLLGNIDVAKADNFIEDNNHDVYLIDAGANFMFRAKGAVRNEDATLASEVDSLRDASINAEAHQWFASLTTAEIAAQVAALAARHQEIEAAVWEASNQLRLPEVLRNRFLECLSDRLDYLVTRYCRFTQQYAKCDKKARENKTAAGILTYALKDNVPYILFSKRVRHEWWDNFGGRSETGDHYLLDTARREVGEESGEKLNYTNSELLASPFHDLVTGNGRDQFLYRMYICQHDMVSTDKMQDKEHSDYQWVPVADVLAALTSEERILQEGQQTAVIAHEGKRIVIYPPWLRMLQQPPVLQQLRNLQTDLSVTATHTLGFHDETMAALSYHPLVTPMRKREQISTTMLHRSEMLQQLKHRMAPDTVMPAEKMPEATCLSQSELHIKAVLGDDYQPGKLEQNITKFINTHYSHHSAASANKAALIKHCVALITAERQGMQEHCFFYHACNEEVAFAYDVYTALYQRLQADDQWVALRADSAHFKRFANIHEFVAHYSDDGRREIHNDVANFSDCALSTNVFLFGNHETDSSSSIYYFAVNKTSRPMNLEVLFNQLLRPFHVTTEEIRRLLQVFAEHRKNRGGTMYQIAVPHAEVKDLAYPAGFVGVMNKYHGSTDVSAILGSLRESNLHEMDTLRYIYGLQARLMVPPQKRLPIQALPWQEAKPEEKLAYQQALQTAMGHIFTSLLRNYSALHANHRKTATIDNLPDIFRANQLSLSVTISEAALVRAILTNDEEVVRAILTCHPELKNRLLDVPREYVPVKKFKTKKVEGKLPVDKIMLKYSRLNLSFIQELFGEDSVRQWVAVHMQKKTNVEKILGRIAVNKRLSFFLANEPHLQRNWDMVAVLKVLPSTDALQVAQQYSHRIDSLYVLIGVIKLLPEEHVLEFAAIYSSLFPYLENRLRVAAALSEKNRKTFIDFYCHPRATNFGHVRDILRVLAIGDRLNYLEKTDFITTLYDLTSVLELLPEDERVTFAIRHESLYPSVYGLTLVLNHLSARSIEFALRYKSLIKDGKDLSAVLAKLPNDQRLSFARDCLVNIHDFPQLETVTDKLSQWDRRVFVELNQQHIKNSTHFSKIASLLPEEERLSFVDKHENLIIGGDGIVMVLPLLPENVRLDFVLHHFQRISSSGSLVLCLQRLSEAEAIQVLEQAESALSLPTDQRIFELIPFMSAAKQRKMLTDNIRHITSAAILARAMRLMPSAERYDFALSLQHLITDGEDILLVLSSLDNNTHIKFFEYFKNKVNSCEQLGKIGRIFEYRIGSQCIEYIINSCEHLIHSGEDLYHLMEAVSYCCRIEFIQPYLHLLTTPEIFIKILPMIHESMRMQFVMSARKEFINRKNIKSICDCLRQEDGTKLIMDNLDLIGDSMSAPEFVQRLSPVNAYYFVQTYVKHLTSIAELEQLLLVITPISRAMLINMYCDNLEKQVTPLSFRDFLFLLNNVDYSKQKQFALKHLDCVGNGSEIGKLMDCFSPLIRLELAHATKHLIRNCDDLYQVVRRLAPSHQLVFALANRNFIKTKSDLDSVMSVFSETSRAIFFAEATFALEEQPMMEIISETISITPPSEPEPEVVTPELVQAWDASTAIVQPSIRGLFAMRAGARDVGGYQHSRGNDKCTVM